MNTYKIAVIAGDGIGPEVISEGVRVFVFYGIVVAVDSTSLVKRDIDAAF